MKALARADTLSSEGMHGTNLHLLCKFMRKFDSNGDGIVDESEFKELIQVCPQAKRVLALR